MENTPLTPVESRFLLRYYFSGGSVVGSATLNSLYPLAEGANANPAPLYPCLIITFCVV
jgi:hypothetical protein